MSNDRARSLVGTNTDGGRPKDDFYPTPPGATLALLQVETFDECIWEPACGDGAISDVLKSEGYKVTETDLNNHGRGIVGLDFLDQTWCLQKQIVTNPPFNLAEEFIQKAVDLGIDKFAYLGKLQFLEGQKRSRLLEQSGLARVWVFRNRLKLTRNCVKMKNGGMIAFAWYVFEKGYTGKPVLGWVEEVK